MTKPAKGDHWVTVEQLREMYGVATGLVVVGSRWLVGRGMQFEFEERVVDEPVRFTTPGAPDA